MFCLNAEFELEILIHQEVICEKSRFEVEDDKILVWSLNL
jgi:hypothetical protein